MSTQRLEVTYAESPTTFDADGRDLLAGLRRSPKFIPSHYSYDAAGSALFEAVTREPLYYLYRCELEVIDAHGAEIAAICRAGEVVELGSGAARKTRTIIRAVASGHAETSYVPVDISEEILLSSSRELLRQFPTLRVAGLATRYSEALEWLRARAGPPRLYVHLGSSLGNMETAERLQLLREIRQSMKAGDHLLVGFDLAKARSVVEAAYGTPASDAFILNKLTHLNYRFDGDFDLSGFTHRAVYDEHTHVAEARIVATRAHTVNLRRLAEQFVIDAGEHLVAERMFKFTRDGLSADLTSAGLGLEVLWTDRAVRYGVALCMPA